MLPLIYKKISCIITTIVTTPSLLQLLIMTTTSAIIEIMSPSQGIFGLKIPRTTKSDKFPSFVYFQQASYTRR